MTKKDAFTSSKTAHPLITLKLDEDDQEGRIHFQQDGTPSHYLEEVREYLNTRFPGRWIGTAGSMATSFPGSYEGEWSASHPGRFISGEEGWMGPRAGLDDCREQNPGRNPSLYRQSYAGSSKRY
jgi:hypothetical protein